MSAAMVYRVAVEVEVAAEDAQHACRIVSDAIRTARLLEDPDIEDITVTKALTIPTGSDRL
jgi:hypothetical protein